MSLPGVFEMPLRNLLLMTFADISIGLVFGYAIANSNAWRRFRKGFDEGWTIGHRHGYEKGIAEGFGRSEARRRGYDWLSRDLTKDRAANVTDPGLKVSGSGFPYQ